MCLAVPGRVTEIFEENGLRMGRVDFAGTVNRICLAYVPEAEVGEFVIAHAGFAIQVLQQEEASKSLEALEELVRSQMMESSSEER